MEFKPIQKYTRAGKEGKFIKCPLCKETALVYHFSWCSLTCLYCEEQSDKSDWEVEVKV
tara:strand:- start:526 stop:702 length:177 start_codon:yes stop_codon:yes gene_type:complete